MEYDSLIILPEFKLIINIEVKRGSCLKVLKDAADQTKKHFSFFMRVFGSLLSTQWKFVKAACIPNLIPKEKIPCNNCNNFYVKNKDILNIEQWLSNITKECEIFKERDFKEEYESLLEGLIGFSSLRNTKSLNNLILNPQEFRKQTQMKLVGNDHVIFGEHQQAIDQKQEETDYLCYMLNQEQLAAVKCSSPYIIINGDYGTGKTFVLKETHINLRLQQIYI